MATNKLAIRRDTAANWTAANQTLVAGEFALETDSHKLKNGDGSTAYTSLGYLRPINAVTVTGNHTVASNEDVVNVNAASATITLPAADVIGRRVTVRKVSASAGTVTVSRASTDTIEGATSKVIKAQYGTITVEVSASGTWAIAYSYEQGTWTPAYAFSGGSVAYESQQGVYTKIGRAVNVSLRVTLNGVTSPTGAVTITGLPFSAMPEPDIASASVGAARSFASDIPIKLGVFGSPASFQIEKNTNNNSFSSLQGTDLTATCSLYATVTYTTDE